MEATIDALEALLKTTWKWLLAGGLATWAGRPLASAAAEWWRDRIARNSDYRRRRAAVVDGLQVRLVDWMRPLEAASSILPLHDPRGLQPLRAATQAESEARRYIETHRHYLPSHTVEAEIVDRFCKEARRAWAALDSGAQTRDLRGDEAARQATQLTMKGQDIVHHKLPPIREELQRECSRLAQGKRSRSRRWRRLRKSFTDSFTDP